MPCRATLLPCFRRLIRRTGRFELWPALSARASASGTPLSPPPWPTPKSLRPNVAYLCKQTLDQHSAESESDHPVPAGMPIEPTRTSPWFAIEGKARKEPRAGTREDMVSDAVRDNRSRVPTSRRTPRDIPPQRDLEHAELRQHNMHHQSCLSPAAREVCIGGGF